MGFEVGQEVLYQDDNNCVYFGIVSHNIPKTIHGHVYYHVDFTIDLGLHHKFITKTEGLNEAVFTYMFKENELTALFHQTEELGSTVEELLVDWIESYGREVRVKQRT